MLSHPTLRRAPLALILVGALLTGCVAIAPPLAVEASESVTESAAVGAVAVDAAPSQDAAESATDALLYMREEEKLAHDVYVTLYQQWDLPVFDNISRAESQHMSMVLQALDARGLADPAAGKGLGEFMNADLQALYDELVAQGSESVVAALTAGATIEDLDISDLQASLKTVTDEDVRWVFETLLRGSENHMRAFVRNLDRYGETYEPQFIDSAYFDAIASGDMARGPQAGRGQGRQQGGGRWQR